MKAQQKPVFLVKKFYSILQASVAVETVSFFVTLSDSVIAGNMIGNETLVAVGLLSPLFTIRILDVMGSDGTGSLREYAVSRLVLLPEYNMYLTTVGYNRNELWLNGTAE